MSAISTITLTDATPVTPVNRAFVPLKITGDRATYVYRSTYLVGNQKLHITVREPVGNEVYGKVILQLVQPTLEVSAGSTGSGLQAAPTKAYDNFSEIELKFHKRSTAQERKDLRVMLVDLLSNEAAVMAAWDNVEPIY